MINREEVIKLAKLSKLSFKEEEIEIFQKDLNDIFLYMENLNELDLENVIPLYNVLDIQGRVYKDEVKEEISKKDFLDNSPKHDDNFIILPIIIGGDNNE